MQRACPAVKVQGEREGLAEAIHLGTAVTRGKQTSLSLVAVCSRGLRLGPLQF